MILKNLFWFFFITIFVTASDPYFGIEFSFKPVPSTNKSDVREKIWMSTTAFEPYLKDSKDRVSDTFKISPFFYPNVNFWFMIYTQFESSTVVLHDKNNLALIYKVLDFSHLHEKKLPKNTLYVLQQKITKDKTRDMEEALSNLAKSPFSQEPEAKKIYRNLQQAKIRLPNLKRDRVQFFLNLKKNLRTQTGQKNFIRDGIIRSLPYQVFIQRYFETHKLPKELFAIPFLESSFNPRAESKVNALGVWQFMPLIASYYVPKRTTHVDYRSNVGVASLSAGFLMSENLKIMKSWDLAVTAYNSGTKHLLKTKRRLGKKNVSLETIIKNSDSEHFGFASKNFYAEFLALAHTLAYREELFDNLHSSDRSDVDDDLLFYVAKCSIKASKDLSSGQLEDLKFHNHHISDFDKQIIRGLIVTTKSKLPQNRFHLISYKELVKTKPKDWSQFLRNQSCSTR